MVGFSRAAMPEDEVPSGAGGSGDQVADGDEHAPAEQAGRWDQVCAARHCMHMRDAAAATAERIALGAHCMGTRRRPVRPCTWHEGGPSARMQRLFVATQGDMLDSPICVRCFHSRPTCWLVRRSLIHRRRVPGQGRDALGRRQGVGWGRVCRREHCRFHRAKRLAVPVGHRRALQAKGPSGGGAAARGRS